MTRNEKLKKARDYYEGFRDKITDELMIKSVLLYKKNAKDENSFHFCVGAYICSDDEIRSMLKSELGENDKVILTAEEILNNTKTKK